MKTIVLKNLEYQLFEKIRDILDTFIPFAFNGSYSRKLKQGKFIFQDSFYIPNILWKYTTEIKGNVDLIMDLNRALTEIMDEEKVKARKRISDFKKEND